MYSGTLDFIHNDPEFKELLSIVSTKKGIDITLVEKDYWIVHELYSLQQQEIEFELKGQLRFNMIYRRNYHFNPYKSQDNRKPIFQPAEHVNKICQQKIKGAQP